MAPRTRFGTIADNAAQFTTSIDIDEPRLITIEVEAPYAFKGNMIKSSTQLWVIPDGDITGDGIIVEVPGDAQVPETVSLSGSKAAIPLQAGIVMI